MRTGRAGHLVKIWAFCELRFAFRKCLYTVPALCDCVHTCTALRSTSGKSYKITQSLMCFFKSTCRSVRAYRSACWEVYSPTSSGLAQFPYILADGSCIFTYIPFSYHSFNRQTSAVILFSNGAWTPRTCWRARCAYREGFWVIHRHFPASSHCQGLIFSPQEGRSSSGFLLGQIDVSLLPLLWAERERKGRRIHAG